MKKIIALIILFAGTNIFGQKLPESFEMNTAARLQKSNDNTPSGNTIERILVAGNTVWFGGSRGLSKTDDNGASFTNYYNTDAFGTESVSAVGYHDGAVWAAKWHNEDFNGDNVAVGTGLCYSNNGGTDWVKIDQPLDKPGDSSIVYGINKIRALPVTVAQKNFVYQMSFSKNTIWIAAFAGGLRKSTDMGQTWQRVVLPPDYLNSIKPTDSLHFSLQPVAGKFGNENYLNHRVFSVLAVDDDTIYVGTAGGINKSTDGGVSWVKFNHTNQQNPISGNFIWTMDYDKYNHTVWAATWKAEGQSEYYAVSYSADGGKKWNIVLPDEKTHDFGFNYYGAPSNLNSVDIFAATENGLYRSMNGRTWVAAPAIMDKNSSYKLNTEKFLSTESQKIGDAQFNVWAGTDLDGLLKYYDNTGSWNGDWTIYLKAGNQISSNDSFAFPNPFSPDDEIVRIKYRLTNSSDVTIRIFDFGMNLVKTLIQNVSRNSSVDLIETWDGKNESGSIVPNGVYFYRIDAGSNDPLYGKIMVVM